MRRLFSLPIRLQLFIIVFIMTIFSFGIIVYSGVSLRNEKIKESLRDANILADIVANENIKMVADMQQLMTALVQLPEVRSLRLANMQPVLKNILDANPKYSNIFIADRAGRVVASALPSNTSVISDRMYYKNAISTGRFSSGEYIISRFTGRPVMPFAYPIRNSRGDVTGIIAMGIDLTYYKALLDTLQLPSGSSFLLLDHKGIIMTRGIKPLDFVGEKYDRLSFKKMAEGPEVDTFVAFAHDRTKRFISYRKLRLEGQKTPYMYVRAGIPVDSTLAQADRVLIRNLGLLTISLCLIVLLVLFIGKRSIVDRIALLERASRRLAAGELDVKVSDLLSGGELGQLGLTFDHMTSQIALREEALEQKTMEQKAILTNALVGIAFLKDRRFVWINDKMEEMFGYRMSEVIGLTTELFYPSREGYEQLGSEAYPVLAAGGTYYAERLMKRKDGSFFWCSLSGKIIDRSRLDKGAIWVLEDITARKQAAQALLMSEERLRQAVRVSDLGIFEHDHPANTIYWSPRQREIYGWGHDEPVTLQAFIDCIHPEDREKIVEDVRRAHDPAGNGLFDVEHRIIRSDGSIRWVTTRSQTFFSGEDGSRLPVQTIGAVRDITERKRFEDKLQESELRLNTVLNNVGAYIFMKDTEYRYVYANQLVCDLFGVRPEDIRGRRDNDFFTPDSAEEIMRSDRPVIESGETIRREETELAASDRQPRTYWTVKLPLRDTRGTVIGLCGISTDITELKQAERELEEKEEKYRLLFESANDGIFILGTRGFIDCNKKGADMYGRSKEELLGRWPAELSPERQPDGRSSPEAAAEIVKEALTGVPKIFEWQSMRADGSPFDVEITLSRFELGGEICLQAIVRDITERKRLEEGILNAQKLESIGTLAGGIAHDFNNLLQGIFGYISLAKMNYDEKEKALRMLDQAEKALNQAVNLTTQLLTFSKGGKPVKKLIDVGTVIENSAKFTLSGSRSDLLTDIPPDLWKVEADEGQIGQVIQNVVLNADQAMPEGGTIVVVARNLRGPRRVHSRTLGEGIYVEISVSDTGIGIPDRYLQKIFDPYFTTKEKGSGLGLATSYSIIRNHGGLIDVVSESGKGTTFNIYLPAVRAIEESAEKREMPPAFKRLKVLVMDDEELLLNIAGEMIKALGHDMDTAKHGESAIEKYRSAMDSGKPYDVVILDLTIRGGLGGKETLRRLIEIDSNVKAVVSSGYSNDEVVSEYQKYGFMAHLSKPYKIADLRDALNVLAANKPSQADSE